MGQNDETALVRVDQAAQIAGVTTRTLNRWVKEGRVVHSKDKFGVRVVAVDSLPRRNGRGAFEVTTTPSEIDDETMRETHEQETEVTTRNPMVEMVHEAVALIKVYGAQTKDSVALALEGAKQERADLYEELRRVRDENQTLHAKVRELLGVQEELLDRAAERGLLIQEFGDDLERKRENRALMRHVLGQWIEKKIANGNAKPGDAKLAHEFLDRFVGPPIKGADDDGSEATAESEDQKPDPQGAPSE